MGCALPGTLRLTNSRFCFFYVQMNHFEANLMALSRIVDSKVLRMAIQFDGFFCFVLFLFLFLFCFCFCFCFVLFCFVLFWFGLVWFGLVWFFMIKKRNGELRGYCTPGPYFWRLCAFSQKNKANLDKVSYGSGQKYSKELKKSQFYFSRVHCCEVTVKSVRKSIFSMFWAINQ